MAQVKFSKPHLKVGLIIRDPLIVSNFSFFVVKPYDPDSNYSIKALHRLEACCGISVLSTLDAYLIPLRNIVGFTVAKGVSDSSTLILSDWRMRDISQMKLLPTWKNLLWIINQLNLVDLAQQMEAKLKALEAVVLRQQSEMTAGRQAIQGKACEKTGMSI